MQANPTNIAPWYRQGWFWFIVSIPMASVCLGTTMLIVAFTNPDTLVKDDYYRDGKAINQVIARNLHAETLQLSADINIDELTGEVLVQLNSLEDQYPKTLQLSFLSPTLEKEDQTLTLQQISPDRFIGQLESKFTGRRYIHLETISAQESHKPSEDGWLIEAHHHVQAGEDFHIGYYKP